MTPSTGGCGPYYNLLSSCVVCPERLDVSDLGPDCKKFEVSKDYLDMILSGAPCEQEVKQHVGASQIFPLLHHGNYRTPTIKHHCFKTSISSSRRACSNKVMPNGHTVEGFARWFRRKYIPKFLNIYEQGPRKVNIKEWERKYTQNYADKIEESISNDVIRPKVSPWYKAFSKSEQQFTQAAWYDKETPINNVKERQICGPSDQKKAYANAFVNILEGIAHEGLPQYCGRKNWIEICATLEKGMVDIGEILFSPGDGGGFDMTQKRVMNELMNELIMACANSSVTDWDEPLNAEWVREALEVSLTLLVTMDNGKIVYETEGRASGDGWTTFGNTMLMIAYYEYTLYMAGITKYVLLVKGDDVLIGLRPQDIAVFTHWHAKHFVYSKDPAVHGLGQVADPLVWGPITSCSFLSNHFFYSDSEHLRMTRIPARIIQSNSWSTKMVEFLGTKKENQVRRELCYSKGKSLLAWATGLPIWEALGQKMVALGQEGKHTEYDQYADKARVWHKNEDRKSYLVYLQDNYGVTESMVQRMERTINSITHLDGFARIPDFELFYSTTAA